MRAAKEAGHTGRGFGPRRQGGGGSRFGRGNAAGSSRARRPDMRRVIVKMRVVRHAGTRFRAAPIARHVAYLEREGRSEEHTSELQSLIRTSYAVFCLKQKTQHQ